MAEMIFITPEEGSEVVAPDPHWLRELVLSRGADFWCSGSGQGWLKHPGGAELLLAFATGHGFYLEYIDHSNYWITLSPERREGKVSLWVGGDPIIVSVRFFVPADLAWAAVEEFCATGKRAKALSWVPRNEVDWNYGYWDHPDVKVR